jgi:hypothetical protein
MDATHSCAVAFLNTPLTGAMSDCVNEAFMEFMIAGLVLILGAVTYLIYRLAATLQERK